MESHGGNRKVRWLHILFKGEVFYENQGGIDQPTQQSELYHPIRQPQHEQQPQQLYQPPGFLPPGVVLPPQPIQQPIQQLHYQQDSKQTEFDTRAHHLSTQQLASDTRHVTEDETINGDHDIPDEVEDDEYLLEFRRRGWDVMRVPVLKFKYKQLDKLAELLDTTTNDVNEKNSNGLILSSPRVVEALRRAVEISVGKQENLKKFNPHLVFVVGEKTGSDLMKKLQINYNRDSAKTGNLMALRDYILTCVSAHVAPLMIYAKSDRADHSFYHSLSQNKRIRVQPIVVYETKSASNLEPSKHGLSQFQIDDPETKLIVNLIFFSPSGVEAAGDSRSRATILTDICDHFSHIKDITFKYSAIGDTTRAALIARKSDVFCVAPEPNARSFADEIEFKIYSTDINAMNQGDAGFYKQENC